MVGTEAIAGGRNPLIAVASPSEVDAEAAARAAALNPPRVEPRIEALAGHIRTSFQNADRHKSRFILSRLFDCQRRMAGVYSSDKLAAIQAAGANDTYHNITATKADAFAAWLADNISPVEDKPWGLEPTPIPDIPVNTHPHVAEAAVLEFNQLGAPSATPDNVERFVGDLVESMKRQMLDEAQRKTKNMERKIEDQLAEARFFAVLLDFIQDFRMYPAAFIKGPIPMAYKSLKYTPDGALTVADEVRMGYYAPSPFAMYPEPNARNLEDGYLIEVLNWDVTQLSAMRGQPGWDSDAINAVLSEIDGNTNITYAFVTGEPERAQAENRDVSIGGGLSQTTTQGLDFWGLVQNKDLAKWEIAGTSKAPHDFTHVHAILFGRHVVYAVANPDPLGRKPYSVSSFRKVKDSIFGVGLPELMADCQDPVNACLRNLIDNLAFCAGPMVQVDIDATPEGFDPTLLRPRMVFQYNGLKAPSARKPVEFFQPSANADTLLKVAEYFESKADDRTQIPRYVHGNEDVSGAGQTASGMSMLMSNASKGVKHAIRNVDVDIIQPCVSRLYDWNMLHDTDPEIRADAKAVARGALAMIQRELNVQRQKEFLAQVNNPVDQQIIGLMERAVIHRNVAKDIGLPVDDVIPRAEVLEERLREQAAMAAGMTQEEEVGKQGQSSNFGRSARNSGQSLGAA